MPETEQHPAGAHAGSLCYVQSACPTHVRHIEAFIIPLKFLCLINKTWNENVEKFVIIIFKITGMHNKNNKYEYLKKKGEGKCSSYN